mmetsp:Transcript_20401/g.30328  ORF Transcript_20401/g.30328 Transcript_20401/m.30328 type:complete len:144 (+) Transcript_20401:312-743(+)
MAFVADEREVQSWSINRTSREMLQRLHLRRVNSIKVTRRCGGALLHIGLDPKEEVLMGSGYRIDAIVEVNEKTIAVEVDGPSHFIGRSKSPTGSTILKRRQVPPIDGIELVSVPYWNWDKLGKDKAKKQEYLRHLLGLKIDNE